MKSFTVCHLKAFACCCQIFFCKTKIYRIWSKLVGQQSQVLNPFSEILSTEGGFWRKRTRHVYKELWRHISLPSRESRDQTVFCQPEQQNPHRSCQIGSVDWPKSRNIWWENKVGPLSWDTFRLFQVARMITRNRLITTNTLLAVIQDAYVWEQMFQIYQVTAHRTLTSRA